MCGHFVCFVWIDLIFVLHLSLQVYGMRTPFLNFSVIINLKKSNHEAVPKKLTWSWTRSETQQFLRSCHALGREQTLIMQNSSVTHLCSLHSNIQQAHKSGSEDYEAWHYVCGSFPHGGQLNEIPPARQTGPSQRCGHQRGAHIHHYRVHGERWLWLQTPLCRAWLVYLLFICLCACVLQAVYWTSLKAMKGIVSSCPNWLTSQHRWGDLKNSFVRFTCFPPTYRVTFP